MKCQAGYEGQCSKCQLKNSIADFIDACKRYQQDDPSYETFKGKGYKMPRKKLNIETKIT